MGPLVNKQLIRTLYVPTCSPEDVEFVSLGEVPKTGRPKKVTGAHSKTVPHVNSHALSEMFTLGERLTIAMQLGRDNS